MARGDNECIPLYEPGAAISAKAEAAVTGKRFVDISDPKEGPVLGAGLSSTVEGQNIVCSHAAAGARALGVASYDAGVGERFYVIRGGHVVPVTAGANITAGQQVEVGTSGQAIPLASGIAVGKALDDAASGADALIALY